jgi:hypothetical protein
MLVYVGKVKDLKRFINNLKEKYGETATIKSIIEKENGKC